MANAGNMSGAAKLNLQNTPLATVTKNNKEKCYKYYPQQGADGKTTRVYEPAHDITGPKLLNVQTTKTFQVHKKGKGAGPYTGITAILSSIAISSTQNLHIVWHYFLLFANNTIPLIIQ
eukprot:3324524-Ditylum_brightwellii.AAC.1